MSEERTMSTAADCSAATDVVDAAEPSVPPTENSNRSSDQRYYLYVLDRMKQDLVRIQCDIEELMDDLRSEN